MAKKTIKKITALEVLDSRGIPTVAAKVILDNGVLASAYVASGTSAGKFEELELRDGDKSRYNGKGVLQAVANIEKIIAPKLKGKAIDNQIKLDALLNKLDGTKQKSRLGANAILGVSLACARVSSYCAKKPLYRHLRAIYNLAEKDFKLPVPMFNLLNGGLHANSGMDIQEFLLILKAPEFSNAVRHASETAAVIKQVLLEKNLETGVGLEGGFEPKLRNSREAIELLLSAAEKARIPKDQMALGLDVAASGLYEEAKNRNYIFKREKVNFSREQLIGWYAELASNYPLETLEDGLEENDWEGWKMLCGKLGDRLKIIGDDLTTTNPERLKQAIKNKAINAIIIKPNQIGTLSETMETIKLAKKNNFSIIVSHRSGETTDPFIADLAVAVNADYVKFGAPCRGERVAKYNRLLEIEKELEQ